MSKKDHGSPRFVIQIVLGGLLAGIGILNLYWSVGMPTGPLNGDFATVGFSGLDNWEFTSRAAIAFGLIILGAASMINANFIGWKETDGY